MSPYTRSARRATTTALRRQRFVGFVREQLEQDGRTQLRRAWEYHDLTLVLRFRHSMQAAVTGEDGFAKRRELEAMLPSSEGGAGRSGRNLEDLGADSDMLRVTTEYTIRGGRIELVLT